MRRIAIILVLAFIAVSVGQYAQAQSGGPAWRPKTPTTPTPNTIHLLRIRSTITASTKAGRKTGKTAMKTATETNRAFERYFGKPSFRGLLTFYDVAVVATSTRFTPSFELSAGFLRTISAA